MDHFFDWGRADNVHAGITPVFTADDIVTRVEELGALLHDWFTDEPVAQVIMNGAFMFAADLLRAMSARGSVAEMDFIQLEKNRKTQQVRLLSASDRPVDGRDVLIIDDIFETGRTLHFAKRHFLTLGAASVTSVILLDKSAGKDVMERPDFKGFDCPDVFVIGYGMDMGYRYRDMPFIGQMGQA